MRKRWISYLMFLSGMGVLVLLISGSWAALVTEIRERLRWSVPHPPQSAKWSPDGTEIAIHYQQGTEAVIERFHAIRNQRKIVWRSESAYFPCFGPSHSLFAGASPPPIKALTPKRSRVPKKSSASSTASQAPNTSKTDKRSSPPSVPWWKQRGKPGISLFDGGEQQFLFPGYRPLFSDVARKLLFSYQELLYLWDPLLSRRKGLLLLTRGFEPQWSPDGRVIAYLRQPWSWHPGAMPQGGGVMLVDMFFRAAPVAPSGGQVAWAGQGHALAYVDQVSTAKTGSTVRSQTQASVGIFWIDLRKKPARSVLLRRNAWNPAFSPIAAQKHLLAFVDATGVWVMDHKKRKALLVSRGARWPQWSSRGELLVVLPNAIAVIPWTAALDQKLTNVPSFVP